MTWAFSYYKSPNGQELVQSISGNYLKFFKGKVFMPKLVFENTFPSSFNPICYIEFQWEKIKVYDVLGNEIQPVNNRTLPIA